MTTDHQAACNCYRRLFRMRIPFPIRLANVNSHVHVRMLSPVRLSVCLPVCLSITLVHSTQAVVIFGNISTAFGTMEIR